MKRLLAVFLFCLSFVQFATAVTAWYQPTPYPTKAVIDASYPVIGIPHVTDGWLNNSYNQYLLPLDEKLQVGGWGDQYRTFIKIDTEGLPKDATQAVLWLATYPRGDASTPVPLGMCKMPAAWDTSLEWNSQPATYPSCWWWYAAPTTNQWWGPEITAWYNEWQNGTTVNNGVMLFPQYNDNRFDMFRSSRYASEGFRPLLQLDFTPTLELKMPFEAYKWSVTTEVGGGGCSYIHPGHQGNGYFSIDFSWNAKDANGNAVYSGSTANIPILAAATGTVRYAHYSTSAGNYVEIVHGTTGITTRYLHMKSLSPSIHEGVNQVVVQGQFLGYMGDMGSDVAGVHLDFNIQYNGLGDKGQAPLAKVTMEGLLMKSYQIDGCVGNASSRYYTSSNVMIP